MRKLSERLEEYGNERENAISIIKAIDSVESEKKARHLANLTQSVINSEIDVKLYMRLIHVSKQLIEEDISFLATNITKEMFVDNPHLDDFFAYGLIRGVDGGYVYTERAWDLVQYGISRGHDVNRPDEIPKRTVFAIGISDYGYED